MPAVQVSGRAGTNSLIHLEATGSYLFPHIYPNISPYLVGRNRAGDLCWTEVALWAWLIVSSIHLHLGPDTRKTSHYFIPVQDTYLVILLADTKLFCKIVSFAPTL